MGFQFNMEVLNDFPIAHLSSHDRSIVHKVFNRNENAIDEERMPGRKAQITMRILIVQSKASYPDLSYARMSCTRFRRHRVRCFMEQEVHHGETAVYAGVQA